MSRRTSEPSEEQRAYLQARVTLFAKVILIVVTIGSTLAVIVYAAGGLRDQLVEPWFWLYGLLVAVSGAAWLLCRSGTRSVSFSRGAEAGLLLSLALVSSLLVRLAIPATLPQMLGESVGAADPGHDRIVGMLATYFGMAQIVALTLMVVLRAAIVPSRVGHTATLTALVGVVSGAIMATGAVPLERPETILAHTPADLTLVIVVNFGLWWTLSSVVCVAISRIIYGLRREIRRARQLGQYVLEERLGAGGMGEVFRARHALLRRPTAIKLLSPDKAGEAAVARFEREVQLSAQLTHPNTITIFDYGRSPDGVFYYAMELLDGADLEDVVEQSGPMPAGRALKVLAEVASSLDEAHRLGLIHRDVKPANIILCRQGGRPDVAKLVDFGLVKDLGGAGDAELTFSDSILGTPYYMAPESITSPEKADGRSDIYALGAVGYFMVTGQHIFTAGTIVEVLSHHLTSEPEPPSSRLGAPVPEDLEALLLSCLAKDPKDRPQTARLLREQVEACRSHGEWSETDARAWWAEHDGGLRSRRPGSADGAQADGRPADTEHADTLAVDFEGRGGPPPPPWHSGAA